jgi:ligand-binding SRPBCC domain-containing protein
VLYEVPMGAVGAFFAGWLVLRDVERIFDYRARQISAIFKNPVTG